MGVRLGQKLTEIRKQNGLTQDEVVRKAEDFCRMSSYKGSPLLSRSALANYERGIRTPDNYRLRILSHIYDYPYEELISIASLDIAMESDISEDNDFLDKESRYRTLLRQKMRCERQTADSESNSSDQPKTSKNLSITFSRKDDTGGIDLPITLQKSKEIANMNPKDFVLIYCSRDELVLLEKIKRLNTENRKKIEDRIDTILDMQ